VLLTDARLHALRDAWLHLISQASFLLLRIRLQLARRRIDATGIRPEIQQATIPEIWLPMLGLLQRVRGRTAPASTRSPSGDASPKPNVYSI
jgi:hypothetical protein